MRLYKNNTDYRVWFSCHHSYWVILNNANCSADFKGAAHAVRWEKVTEKGPLSLIMFSRKKVIACVDRGGRICSLLLSEVLISSKWRFSILCQQVLLYDYINVNGFLLTILNYFYLIVHLRLLYVCISTLLVFLSATGIDLGNHQPLCDLYSCSVDSLVRVAIIASHFYKCPFAVSSHIHINV